MEKKWASFLLSFIFIIMLSACTSSIGIATQSEDSQVQEETGKITIYLVRHGENILNNTDRVQG